MNKFTKSLMTAALLAALPLSGALACTTDLWDTTTAADAGNPKGRNSEPVTKRYSGTCGLSVALAGSSFVTDNKPGSEAIYRARFYVFTGSAANSPKIFSASAADNNGGTEAFSIAITGGNALAFTVNGTTVPTVPVTTSKWYGVEVFYNASGQFTAKVRGAGQLTAGNASEVTVTSAGNAGAVNVGSARLGVLNAAAQTTALAFDAFESTRSSDTPIGRLCPGDADGNNIVNVQDAIAAIDEFPANGIMATGQPDCDENGLVNSVDAGCAATRFQTLAFRNCSVR